MARACFLCQPQHVACPFPGVHFGSEEIKFKGLLIRNFIVEFLFQCQETSLSTALANTQKDQLLPTVLTELRPFFLSCAHCLCTCLAPLVLVGRNLLFADISQANTECLLHLAHHRYSINGWWINYYRPVGTSNTGSSPDTQFTLQVSRNYCTGNFQFFSPDRYRSSLAPPDRVRWYLEGAEVWAADEAGVWFLCSFCTAESVSCVCGM